tara:strand:+ start:174 stop:596 length:423 start_codon:yes stop_codon:yes gene_type:complete
MATILTIKFPRSNYPSLQVGDTAYCIYSSNIEQSGGFTASAIDPAINEQDVLTKVGTVSLIDYETTLTDGTLTTTIAISVEENENTFAQPGSSDFFLFSKDNVVNLSSLLGYFGSAVFKNNSSDKAELYSASCEVSESSK